MEDTRFTTTNILENLLAGLPERSRDVIISRFGVGKEDYETLEAIGQRYDITRERVRQIEADALKHIEKKNLSSVSEVLSALESYIENHGGAMDEHRLTTDFADTHFTDVETSEHYSGLVRLLLTIAPQFEYKNANEEFTARWFVDEDAVKTQEKIVDHVVSELDAGNAVVQEGALARIASTPVGDSLDTQTVHAYIASSKQIDQNVFGQWGLADWPEIKPRGVKDKAFLVMKEEDRPLHFREVADLINKSDFSDRAALVQTVHNELIKDHRFVLVGRGLYALKEWGYKEGTVKDVIERLLQEKGPMPKDDLVEAVLAERFVKPSTVVLNLNSFNRNEDDHYHLA